MHNNRTKVFNSLPYLPSLEFIFLNIFIMFTNGSYEAYGNNKQIFISALNYMQSSAVRIVNIKHRVAFVKTPLTKMTIVRNDIAVLCAQCQCRHLNVNEMKYNNTFYYHIYSRLIVMVLVPDSYM